MDDKKICVYLYDHKCLIGFVYVTFIKGKEHYSFEYSDYALSNNLNDIIVDPDIRFIIGRQYKNKSDEPYHFLCDSSPDRWGRNLIRRYYKDTFLHFSDYLLFVSDVFRMGGLRYSLIEGGPFLGETHDIPPFHFLNKIENAAYNYESGDESEEDLKILLSPGSSLGGARPKATLYDNNRDLYIAKFSHKNDEYDVSKIEYFTNLLAKEAGINVPEFSYIHIKDKRSVFMSKRFDRIGEDRLPYISFMTLLNAEEGDSSSYTYLDIANLLLQKSYKPNEDLKELFRRLAFYLIVHNYDDHLRNIGMLRDNGGWRLSPCFDINIDPYKSGLTISIDGKSDNTINALLKNCKYFHLKDDEALTIVNNVISTIKEKAQELGSQLNIDKQFIYLESK